MSKRSKRDTRGARPKFPPRDKVATLHIDTDNDRFVCTTKDMIQNQLRRDDPRSGDRSIWWPRTISRRRVRYSGWRPACAFGICRAWTIMDTRRRYPAFAHVAQAAVDRGFHGPCQVGVGIGLKRPGPGDLRGTWHPGLPGGRGDDIVERLEHGVRGLASNRL